MLLCDRQIREAVDEGRLGLDPFDPNRLQPASYDVTLAHQLRLPCWHSIRRIDLVDVPEDHTTLVDVGVHGWIRPGEFLLASTVERVRLPGDLAARVEGKSSLGRLGLAVHITAGFIDPGFEGQVTLEIANLSPWNIRLREGMPIGQLAFMPMSAPPDRLYGSAGNHYQHQSGPVESRYKAL